ncbi:MAG: hypothetical protein PHX80_05505 [Candidatus Nanoarchaeia archaeon]|nr:hypothetical protein [Candidatus Nanoarchaeia archaeon]
MNPQELAALEAARSLSPAYEGNVYDGNGDPSIQFEGSASSFADEGKTGLIYSMTITNNGVNAVDRSLALNPGYFSLAAQIKDSTGTAVDAIVTDGTIVGTGTAACTGSGKPKTIEEFLAFLKYNPTRFTGLKMLVDDSAQFDNQIYMKQNSPFRNLDDRQIYPNTYKDSTQTDTKRVEIPLEDFQMDNNTTVVTTVSAGRTVTYTFFVGAIKNAAYELATKAQVAREGLARTYGKR